MQQNSISNHIAQQVHHNSNSTTSHSKNASSGGVLTNHQTVAHYNAVPVPNSTGIAPNNVGQSLQSDRQQQPQHNNDDVRFVCVCACVCVCV